MIVGLAEGMSGKHVNDVVFCTENNMILIKDNIKDFINKMKKTKFAEAFDFLPKVIEIIQDSIKGCNNSDEMKVVISDLKKIGKTLQKVCDNKDEILLNVFANVQKILIDVKRMVKGFKGEQWMELGYALGDVLKLTLLEVGDLTLTQKQIKLTSTLDDLDEKEN